MRRWFLALFVLLTLTFSEKATGQQLLWEKSYGWQYDDELYDVIEAEPGYFIACGTRGQFRHFHGSSEVTVISLLKFNSKGDTIWKKDIGYDGNSPHICRNDSNSFYLISDIYEGLLLRQVMLFRIGFDGVIRDSSVVGVLLAPPVKLIRASDGSLVYTGWAASLPGSGNWTDMVVVHLSPHGQVYWQTRFSPHPYTMGNWVEETPDHRFLASGNAGSNIWAVEIDSGIGLPLRSQFFYQTPSRINFDEKTTCVQQAPGGRYIVSGNMFGSSHYRSYLACYSDFSSASKIWGGETMDSYSLPPHINQDSSIVLLSSTIQGGFLYRIGKDSSIIWSRELSPSLGNSRPPMINSFSYQADSSAIGVGNEYYQGTGAWNDFYLCRIRNVGQPYNPAEPTDTKPRSVGPTSLSAYPTPATSTLIVHSRAKAPLQLVNLTGKVVLTVRPELGGTTQMDVAALPPGMYLLRQGQTTVKVTKE